MIIAKCTHHHEINFQFLIVRINTIYFLHKSLEFLFFDCIGRISSACKPIELVLEPSIKTGKICCLLAKGDQSTKKINLRRSTIDIVLIFFVPKSNHYVYCVALSLGEGVKKRIFYGQADRKRLPLLPLQSVFSDFCVCVFFI